VAGSLGTFLLSNISFEEVLDVIIWIDESERDAQTGRGERFENIIISFHLDKASESSSRTLSVSHCKDGMEYSVVLLDKPMEFAKQENKEEPLRVMQKFLFEVKQGNSVKKKIFAVTYVVNETEATFVAKLDFDIFYDNGTKKHKTILIDKDKENWRVLKSTESPESALKYG
jgi:hypothetical protein